MPQTHPIGPRIPAPTSRPREGSRRQSSSQASSDLAARHRSLLDPVLPLLGRDWQRARLSLGENGRFDDPPACRPEERIEIELYRTDRPALAIRGKARLALGYDEPGIERARSALIAIAAQGGWPIACDDRSLALLTLAERIAASEIPVLLEGPTGTGKEVFARFVHRRSGRASGPFVAVNCAAMPEAMLEGLLFGHRKGAFTGAGEAREGLFRAADGGTLLLDEIGELPLALQAKLLRALQEGEVLPLGATSPVRVDVRIVAATNRILAREVEAGRFREDLLYRLNVFPLALPALRERPGDIAPLAFGLLLRHAGRDPVWISRPALALLEGHDWPGNVRELENVMRRALLLASGHSEIGAEHIVFDQAAPSSQLPSDAPDHRTTLSDIAFRSEAEAILSALDAHGGHRAKTARSLGISERTLRYRLASMRETGLLGKGGAIAGGAA